MKFNKHYLVGTMRTVKMVPAHSPSYTQNPPYKGVKHVGVIDRDVADAQAGFIKRLENKA